MRSALEPAVALEPWVSAHIKADSTLAAQSGVPQMVQAEQKNTLAEAAAN